MKIMPLSLPSRANKYTFFRKRFFLFFFCRRKPCYLNHECTKIQPLSPKSTDSAFDTILMSILFFVRHFRLSLIVVTSDENRSPFSPFVTLSARVSSRIQNKTTTFCYFRHDCSNFVRVYVQREKNPSGFGLNLNIIWYYDDGARPQPPPIGSFPATENTSFGSRPKRICFSSDTAWRDARK